MTNENFVSNAEEQTGFDTDGTVVVRETEKGKQIALYVVPQTCMYAIKFIPGGELPTELKGTFTDPNLAMRAIDLYLKAKQSNKNA